MLTLPLTNKDLKNGNIEVPSDLDKDTMRRQLKFFCYHDLGFNIEHLKYFATQFGWEAVAVGPLHATATEIKNTYSQWLTLLDCLGLRHEFDRMLRCTLHADGVHVGYGVAAEPPHQHFTITTTNAINTTTV